MKINIKGWHTANSNEHLCLSCRHSFRIKGHKESEEIISCDKMNSRNDRITFKVAECSGYSKLGEMGLSEMSEMAFIIEQKKNGSIGFIRSKAFRKKYGWESLDFED